MSACKSCGQKIEWIEGETKKWHPVDPDELEYADANQGDELVSIIGFIYKVDHEKPKPSVKGYVRHVCPGKGEWD